LYQILDRPARELPVSLRDIALQLCQVLTVLALSPLLQGFILRYEERVQRARGPSLVQPYRDLWKLFHKELVVPEGASFIHFAAPVVAFTAMLVVPLLIPVLTNYPLPLSDMGDILGGGLILTLGAFFVTLAGLDSGSAYGGVGSSRSVMVTILAEPTLILVLVGITLLAKAMLPFVVNHLLVADAAVYWSPAHVFLACAFFILLLAETDRLPVHSSTHIEVYMIEEARILEYSGPLLALLKWASMMKQFILYTIFCNVLLLPWGLSVKGTALGAVGAAAALLGKVALVACAVIVVETAQSRLRFYRYQEPLAASFLLAALAVIANQFR
jgi:formate hydrogenlyase subunit 4